jgi:hypothetical protein
MCYGFGRMRAALAMETEISDPVWSLKEMPHGFRAVHRLISSSIFMLIVISSKYDLSRFLVGQYIGFNHCMTRLSGGGIVCYPEKTILLPWHYIHVHE